MFMVAQMPVHALARAVREHDTRLWRLLKTHVNEARSRVDMSRTKEVLVDETSQAKGQEYVSIFMEPAQGEAKPRVLFVAKGRCASVFEEFVTDLEAHGGEASRIRDLCMDMSNSFQKGAAESLPQARITFDRFHVMKLVGEALDEVRRYEQKTRPILRGTRYTWLRNPETLSSAQSQTYTTLSRLNLKTVQAYQMKLNLREVWTQPNAASARRMLLAWCRWVRRKAKPKKPGTQSGLEPMLRLATTIREKAEGILNYFRRHLTQGVIEGLGSIVQAARARARGYRNPETYKTMIYLLGGQLQFNLPAFTH
jgi:transposase